MAEASQHSPGAADETVVVHMNKSGTPCFGLGNVEGNKPVNVRAHKVEHILADDLRISVRGCAGSQHAGQAAVRSERLDRISVRDHEGGIGVDVRYGIECEEMAGQLQAP